MKNINISKKQIIIGVILLAIAITLISSVKTIPTGYVGVKTRFGAVQDTMIGEGINLKVPFIEKIITIDCRTKKIEVGSEAASKDLQTISIKIAVNYNVRKDMANQLYKTTGIDFEKIIINPAVLESVKATTAQYTAEELITKRAEVSNKMDEILTEKIQDKGFYITDFNVIDLSFSEEYNKAIENKQVIEQQTKAAQYELEKAKIENEKKIAEAEANAKVMELQNAQITDKTLELKKLEVQQALINKWDGKLPTTALSDSIPMLNLTK